MKQNLFARFAPTIRDIEICDLDDRLLLDRDGPVSVYYAPFDYINGDAKIVIAGITPGKTQMLNALREARKQLLNGASHETALEAAKRTASFSGAMRPNLINLLDYIGVNKWLRINTCGRLFDNSTKLVQTTSVLRFPVFINGSNYNGTPDMLKHALLRRHLLEHFGAEAALLKNAVFVPLGGTVVEAFRFLAKEGLINHERILDGLPHPSGANAERIAYFLGTKPKERLSAKTDAKKLDGARELLRSRVLALAD